VDEKRRWKAENGKRKGGWRKNTDPVETYPTQLAEVVAEMPRDQIWDVIYALVDAWQRRARVFLLGNGGSAATASHMAYNLNKLIVVPGQPRFKAIALTDNVPLMTA